MCVENVVGCKLVFSRQKTSVYTLSHLNKSVIVSFFDLSLTNTEIISQYRLTYTPHSGLNSLPLYEIERRSELYKKQVNKPFSNFYFSFFALTIASAISLTLCAGDGAFKIPEVAPVPSAPNFTTL